jgi:hypothetical protein
MDDYQKQEMEENQRNPKNRFLGLFCHANQVDSSWGYNWPFWCGVLMFSIVIGLISILDFSFSYKLINSFRSRGGWIVFFFILRILADVITIIGIILAAVSIVQTSFQKATIAYYTEILSFVINIAVLIFGLFKILFYSYGYFVLLWGFSDFVLLLFLWILFCNMVDIGRKVRQAVGANSFQ